MYFEYPDPAGKPKRPRMRYLKHKLGTCIERIKASKGITVDMQFELAPEDFGAASEPDTDSCVKAYEAGLTGGATGY